MDRGPDRRDEGWSMKSRQTGVVRCDGSGETQTLTERGPTAKISFAADCAQLYV